MKTLYTKICPICKNSFTYLTYKSTEERKPKRTCSNTCSYKLRSKSLKGRLIPNRKNQKDSSKWVFTSCKFCKKIFSHQRSIKRTFCSKTCKGEWQHINFKGKSNPNWKEPFEKREQLPVKRTVRRWIIKERVVCEKCKSNVYLQVHHIDRNRNNDLSNNLLLLCKFCHAKIHEPDGQNISNLILSNHKNT